MWFHPLETTSCVHSFTLVFPQSISFLVFMLVWKACSVFFHLQLSSFGLVTTTAASGAPLGTRPKQLDQEFDRGSL